MLLKSFIILSIAILVSSASFLVLLKILKNRSIVDKPNVRSSHSLATPIGGGLVICFILIIGIFLLCIYNFQQLDYINYQYLTLIIILLMLGIVSWIDDLKELPIFLRLLTHSLAVTIGIYFLSHTGSIFQGYLPYSIDLLLTFFIWLWIINLTNFMDGINGITATQGIITCIGTCIILFLNNNLLPIQEYLSYFNLYYLALILTGSLLSFLLWNWTPSKLFLGDVGSIPIGFIFGWIIFELAGAGYWQASILLILYYIMDSTLTLFIRVWKKEKIFQAHNSHFYQKAAIKFNSHSYTVLCILILNIILMFLSIYSSIYPNSSIIFVITGVILSSIFLCYFALSKRKL